MLNDQLIQQIKSLMPLLRREVVFVASLDDSERSEKMRTMLKQIADLSDKVSFTEESDERTPSFALTTPEAEISIRFAGLPMGHEFESFMLAIVQVGGHPPKIDDDTKAAVQSISEEHEVTTYMSLSCQNCPEVVQSLNVMAVLNPKIHHTIVEGGAFSDEIEKLGIKSVPAVYSGGEHIASGRMGISQLLSKLSTDGAQAVAKKWQDQDVFDVLIAGAGPAGASAAIYAARKGLRVGMVAERIGGQVMDTAAIENLVTVSHTEGPKLGEELRQNAENAGVTIIAPLSIESLEINEGGNHKLHCEGSVTLETKSLVLATGAEYRKLGVPGETEYLTKGVTFCPHCDGPLFKGKRVAVVGGGNSGIEAAIDLAGITEHVSVIEFLPECKADQVLLDTLNKLDNVDVYTNSAVKSIDGDGKAVTAVTYEDRESGEERQIELEGIFIQVGLMPRTEWLKDTKLELNQRKEIVTDQRGATNISGIYAAGDCTNGTYKQIVTALGSGATAALSAYEHIAIGR